MGLFNPKPEDLAAAARSFHLRADQLDREGKHGRAAMERKKAMQVEQRASSQRD